MRKARPKQKCWRLDCIGIARQPARQRNAVRKKYLCLKKRFKGIDEPRGQEHPAVSLKKGAPARSCLPPQYPSSKISFYFQEPACIDAEKNAITRFSRGSSSGDNFLAYAYSQILPLHDGLLLHGAAAVHRKKACLFLGVSGGGKTTVAGLSRRRMVLGDDIIAVRRHKGSYAVFCTPWYQSPAVTCDPRIRMPVEALFFLKKSRKVDFRPLAPHEAFTRIISRHLHFFLYTEKPIIEKAFSCAADLVKKVPAYEMEFSKKKRFWPFLAKYLDSQKCR